MQCYTWTDNAYFLGIDSDVTVVTVVTMIPWMATNIDTSLCNSSFEQQKVSMMDKMTVSGKLQHGIFCMYVTKTEECCYS